MTREQILERLEAIKAEGAAYRDELRTLSESDELTDEQEARFDELTGDDTPIERLAKERKDLERKLRVFDAADEFGTPGDSRQAPPPSRNRSPYDTSDIRGVGVPTSEIRGRAFDAVEKDRYMEDFQKQHVTRLIERSDKRGELARHVLATGHPDYRTAWAKALHGAGDSMTNEERDAVANVRAQSLTGNQGGFAVPFTLDPTVVLTSDGELSPLRQISTVVNISTDEWNGVTSAGATASYDAESAEVSDDTITLAQPSIDVEMARAFVPASIEITQDWDNIASELGRVFEDAKMRLEDDKFVTGGGTASTEPYGVVKQTGDTTASRVASTTISAYGLVDVYATLEALPPRYRARASWLANLNIINDTRQFGTANNYHAFLTDLRGDSPGQLLGKPWFEASAMEGAVTTNGDVLLIGDFSRYYIVDRVGMSVEFIPHLFDTSNNRPNGQRGYFAYWRNGAGVIDTNAFRVLRLSG